MLGQDLLDTIGNHRSPSDYFEAVPMFAYLLPHTLSRKRLVAFMGTLMTAVKAVGDKDNVAGDLGAARNVNESPD